MRSWLKEWRVRHQHPLSLALHVVAIPMLPAAFLLVAWQLYHWQWSLWYRPLVLLAVSYLLQWIGHRVEGNDMGEVIVIKRWLNRPYVAIAPRYQVRTPNGSLGLDRG